jgi:hypothetical protein
MEEIDRVRDDPVNLFWTLSEFENFLCEWILINVTTCQEDFLTKKDN